MKVVLVEKAKKQLVGLERPIQTRIVKKLLHVETTGGSILERMKDSPLFRLRVGDYRVIGFIESNTYTAIFVGHRSKVYKELQ